jgi:hypothetical protein
LNSNPHPTSQQQHVRCKSIGSTLEMKSPITPNIASPIDLKNILEHCDEEGDLIARYVSLFKCIIACAFLI